MNVEVVPVELARVEGLVPGATATLYGSGLRGVQQLKVDGDSIARDVVALSDSALTFTMPRLRSCETDGRLVTLVANDADTLHARLRVAEAVTLAVGESRVLQPAAGDCLVLPGRDEDYVLTATSLELPTGLVEQPRRLLRIRSHTEDRFVAQPLHAGMQPTAGWRRHPLTEVDVVAGGTFASDPVLFDPRYATAQVGDTVTLVAWSRTESGDRAICALPRNQVPTYQAAVVALAGRVMVLVDLRQPEASFFLTQTEWIQRAAETADRLLVPTMRSVFNRDFQPPPAAGGRYMTVFSQLGNMGAGFAYDGTPPGGTWISQASCAVASEVVTTLLGAAFWSHPAVNRDEYGLWHTIVHEYAHIVDIRAQMEAGRPRQSVRPFGEAWATLAEETAVRLNTSQDMGARPPQQRDSPVTVSALDGLWGAMRGAGPWQNVGAYSVSAEMLLFARERAGEASVHHEARPSLYQRLYANGPVTGDPRDGARALAAAVGMTLDSLVDMRALASATAGLVDPAVYQTRPLPRFRSWEVADLAHESGPRWLDYPLRISRFGSVSMEMLVPSGAYGAAYAMAEGARGVSLEFVEVGTTPKVVRLTRLR